MGKIGLAVCSELSLTPNELFHVRLVLFSTSDASRRKDLAIIPIYMPRLVTLSYDIHEYLGAIQTFFTVDPSLVVKNPPLTVPLWQRLRNTLRLGGVDVRRSGCRSSMTSLSDGNIVSNMRALSVLMA